MDTELSPHTLQQPLRDAEQLAERRWQAVFGRDRQADGEFVYAVKTTGVYCRPSCPSRMASGSYRKGGAGETASYAEVARRIGQPKAFRTVAHACASNRVAVAIPCHRVVHTDGDLSGYRWGVAHKAELLKREKKS